MIRPIVAYGNPILNQPSSKVDIENEDMSNLIVDMWETMYSAEGVGLAAPQVGESIRLFVVDGTPFGEDDDACNGFKRVMINPVIFESSSEQSIMEEGCLSIPGIRESVLRPNEVRIEYYNKEWELIEEHLMGITARIVQHEYDHLDGVLITDHITAVQRRLLHGKLRDIGLGKVSVDYRMRLPKGKVR